MTTERTRRRNTCATCGAPTDASYFLCRPCVRERASAERVAQGLPPTITTEGHPNPEAVEKFYKDLADALTRWRIGEEEA